MQLRHAFILLFKCCSVFHNGATRSIHAPARIGLQKLRQMGLKTFITGNSLLLHLSPAFARYSSRKIHMSRERKRNREREKDTREKWEEDSFPASSFLRFLVLCPMVVFFRRNDDLFCTQPPSHTCTPRTIRTRAECRMRIDTRRLFRRRDRWMDHDGGRK